MATYKLIQDIEAEDHILGPLTLRQFIFALVAAFLLYICFISVAKHVPFLLVMFLPPALFCAFFAFPFGRDQPTELWALAKLRFWFKPRKRVWNQSGIKELVTITVPKKVERIYSDGLSQSEVKSRLQALANTIDSRGWVIKHIDAVGYTPRQLPVTGSDDRLIDISDMEQDVPNEVPADDIMDADNSPIAQQFQSMINKSTDDYRQRLVDQLNNPLPNETAVAPPQWFMNHNPAGPITAPAAMVVPVAAQAAAVSAQTPAAQQPVAATASAEDEYLSAQLKKRASAPQAYSNLRTLQPLGAQTTASNGPAPVVPATAQALDDTSTPMTVSGDPAILSLSKNNDLNVSTLAREAQRAKQANGGTQDEVVISLH